MSWFFEKINKLGKPPARLTNKKKKMQITNFHNETGYVTTDPCRYLKTMGTYRRKT